MKDKDIFISWLEEMDWLSHGGREAAAEALGKTATHIGRYKNGKAQLSIETRLAMTALAQGLKPWEPKNEGLPAVHFSFSIGNLQ